jgi:hypothetical protein
VRVAEEKEEEAVALKRSLAEQVRPPCAA